MTLPVLSASTIPVTCTVIGAAGIPKTCVGADFRGTVAAGEATEIDAGASEVDVIEVESDGVESGGVENGEVENGEVDVEERGAEVGTADLVVTAVEATPDPTSADPVAPPGPVADSRGAAQPASTISSAVATVSEVDRRRRRETSGRGIAT